MDNKEDIEGFVMDDSSITRMRKFYNHKKDRTLAAPKDTSVTTNTVLDNNVRILLLNGFGGSLGCSLPVQPCFKLAKFY